MGPNNKEKIDILTAGLSAQRKKKKETIDGDRRTPGVDGKRRLASSHDGVFKNLIRPLLRAGTRGDVGFRACSPDMDGTSATGWRKRQQHSNVARKRCVTEDDVSPYIYTRIARN